MRVKGFEELQNLYYVIDGQTLTLACVDCVKESDPIFGTYGSMVGWFFKLLSLYWSTINA